MRKKITDGGDDSTRISVYLIRKLTWDFRPVIDSINLSLDWSSEYGQSVLMHWLICVLLKVAQLLVCQSFGWFFRKTLFSGLVSSQVPFFFLYNYNSIRMFVHFFIDEYLSVLVVEVVCPIFISVHCICQGLESPVDMWTQSYPVSQSILKCSVFRDICGIFLCCI